MEVIMEFLKKYKNALIVIIILLILIFTIGVGKAGGEESPVVNNPPRIFEPPHYSTLYQPFEEEFFVYPHATPTATPKPTAKPRIKIIYPSTKAAQKYALSRVGREQYNCLYLLWQRESGWRTHALNKSSGAYGIPQALPGKKMASAGADWRDNPITQVRWGLGYIKARYGNSCNAWRHFRNRGWY
jgi:hypothetical protein